MYVVNIALDSKVLDPESVVAFRSRAYGELTEHYSLVLPSPANVIVRLSDKTTAYGIGGMNRALQLFGIFKKVRKLIHNHLCNVVTTQDMYYLGLLGVYFSRRYHLGFEVQVLGIEKLTPLRRMIANFVLQRAGVIRALSPRMRDRLVHEFGISPERITVVSIYVDVHKLGLDVRTLDIQEAREFEKAVQEFRLQYGMKFNFLTVSRLVPIKRIEMQLHALKDLLPSFPQLVLHIVGDGPEEAKLTKIVKELDIKAHVVFHGYQTGYMLGLYYIECDCLLLTSDYEGWGMVIIEAASAGMPIIMTNVGCAEELIINEKSGLVIPIGDSPALKNAMMRIIEDKKLRSALSIGATKALVTLPSFEDLLVQYKQNWERALERVL